MSLTLIVINILSEKYEDVKLFNLFSFATAPCIWNIKLTILTQATNIDGVVDFHHNYNKILVSLFMIPYCCNMVRNIYNLPKYFNLNVTTSFSFDSLSLSKSSFSQSLMFCRANSSDNSAINNKTLRLLSIIMSASYLYTYFDKL